MTKNSFVAEVTFKVYLIIGVLLPQRHLLLLLKTDAEAAVPKFLKIGVIKHFAMFTGKHL